MDALLILGNHMIEKHSLNLKKSELQAIVNKCAQIIVMQDHQEYEDKTRESIDLGGGCSNCGDLSGFECGCENEVDEYNEQVEKALKAGVPFEEVDNVLNRIYFQ